MQNTILSLKYSQIFLDYFTIKIVSACFQAVFSEFRRGDALDPLKLPVEIIIIVETDLKDDGFDGKLRF